jgi:hypothetical protein
MPNPMALVDIGLSFPCEQIKCACYWELLETFMEGEHENSGGRGFGLSD